jgi:ribosomal protein L11 methyltransferase
VVALCPPEQVCEVLEAAEQALALARAAGSAVDPVAVRQRNADEEEWRDVWKQFFRATRIGRRFTVRPSWDPGEVPPGEHVIELDPGRAFGTGAHPSTRLAIGFAERLQESQPGLAGYLDLGCGSGILSIAAARLWPAARGLAVDNDPEATACAQENLERNRIAAVRVQAGELDDVRETFDLVMANIQADVLESLAPKLPARVVPGGHAILSGILVEQVESLLPAYARAGFALIGREDEGEWTGLLVRKP